jgi:hypothetical protein
MSQGFPPLGRFLEEFSPEDLPGESFTTFSNRQPRPSNLVTAGLITPVRNQLPHNTCTSFGLCAILESQHLRLTGEELELAPGWIHTCIGLAPPDTAIDMGYVVQRLNNRSAPLASQGSYPWNYSECGVAGAVTVPTLQPVAGIPAIQFALEAGLPVATGMAFDRRFQTWPAGQPYSVDMSDIKKLFHHVVTVVGYDALNGEWLCKNSMGAGWGDNGYVRIPVGACGIGSNYKAYATESVQTMTMLLAVS